MNDEQFENLIRKLFQADKLNVDVTDEEIDEILANSKPIVLSEGLTARALQAMRDAQEKRLLRGDSKE